MNSTLLQNLCMTYGCSGDETRVRALLQKELAPYADRMEWMSCGNLLVWKKGKERPSRRLMLAAHMDEVGMIVTHIRSDGFLKFDCVGGINPAVLSGKHVIIDGKYNGIIGIKPIHLTDKKKKGDAPALSEMVIDIGADSREEAEKLIELGSSVCFEGYYRETQDSVFGKALDDRVGCAILADMIQRDLPYDMIFAFTVQEEVGMRGAQMAAFKIQPDCALVVETTTAADLPGVAPEETVCTLGDGPVVPFMDKATIYDKAYYQAAMKLSEELSIPCQTKRAIAGGNDSGAIQRSCSGVRTIAVSLPCRYLHSPVVMASKRDLAAMEKLVPALAEKMASEL